MGLIIAKIVTAHKYACKCMHIVYMHVLISQKLGLMARSINCLSIIHGLTDLDLLGPLTDKT